MRGKTVQDVLDTLQDVIHPPDLLLLQEVGGLGKGAPDAVLSFDFGAVVTSILASTLIQLKESDKFA